MFSHNGASGSELNTTCMFHPVRQMAAPGAKSAVIDCILFVICMSVCSITKEVTDKFL